MPQPRISDIRAALEERLYRLSRDEAYWLLFSMCASVQGREVLKTALQALEQREQD